MEAGWTEFAQMSGAVAVPLVAVAALFYGMMRHELKPIHTDLKEIGKEVHSVDNRLAKLEGRLGSASKT